MPRRRSLPPPEEIVATIVELADDGVFHLAVSSEGWNRHRNG